MIINLWVSGRVIRLIAGKCIGGVMRLLIIEQSVERYGNSTDSYVIRLIGGKCIGGVRRLLIIEQSLERYANSTDSPDSPEQDRPQGNMQEIISGKYWVRTSDPYLVEVVL